VAADAEVDYRSAMRMRRTVRAVLLSACIGGIAHADRAPVLGPSEIKAAMSAHASAIRACYEKELARKPGLAGKLVVRVVLDADGRVKTATVDSTTLGSPAVESCVTKVVASIRFGWPDYDGFSFVYPLVFAGGDGAPGPSAVAAAPVVVARAMPAPMPKPPPPPPPPPPGTGTAGGKKGPVIYGDDGEAVGHGPPRTAAPVTAAPSTGAGLGYRPPVVPDVKPGPPVIKGSLDKDVIRRVVKKHTAEVRFCYEKELVRDPGLAGTVRVRFVIGTGGEVIDATASDSSVPSPDLSTCLAGVVRRWVFPKPDGGVVEVTYPFTFKSGDVAPSDPGATGPDPLDSGAGAGCTAASGPGLPGVTLSFSGAPSADATAVSSVCEKRDALRACMEVELAAAPGLGGRASVAYTTGAGGKVTKSRIVSSTHGSPTLDACILKITRTVVVPGAAAVERTFSIELKPPLR